jgi:hypothetical protein
VLHHIDGSVKSWQRPGLRHRLVFALLGVLIALSYALLLDGEEAQAKGGKQSPDGGSAGGAIGGSAKPAREAVGEANKLASNGGGEGKGAEPLAARDPAPLADKPKPADNGIVRDAVGSTTEQVADKASSAVDPLRETNPPIVERTGSLGEVAGKANEATKLAVEPVLNETVTSVTGRGLEEKTELPKAEPILEGAAKPEKAPVLNRATSETVPTLERATSPARPVLEETSSTVEPLLDTAISKTQPVLERATAPVSPVLQRTTSTVEPLLGEVNPPIEPALAETLPAVEPVLDGAIPTASAPIGEAVGPITRPPGEEAIPISSPVLEDAAFLSVGPAIGAAAPIFNSDFDTVASAIGSGLGEGVVRQSTGPPVLTYNVYAIPASLSTLQSRALAVETQGALGSARECGSVSDEPSASLVETSGARYELFDDSLMMDGSHTALLGAITAESAREGPPRPFPFGSTPTAPPLGISFGSSGAGVALGLLAILALLPILSRAGGSSWSNRATFKLGTSLRLAVERPG